MLTPPCTFSLKGFGFYNQKKNWEKKKKIYSKDIQTWAVIQIKYAKLLLKIELLAYPNAKQVEAFFIH